MTHLPSIALFVLVLRLNNFLMIGSRFSIEFIMTEEKKNVASTISMMKKKKRMMMTTTRQKNSKYSRRRIMCSTQLGTVTTLYPRRGNSYSSSIGEKRQRCSGIIIIRMGPIG